MPSDPKRCSWDEEGDGCGLVNFQTTVGLEILEYEGRDYCLLHLHLKAKRDKYTVQPNSLSQIFHQLQIAGATDFRGVQLPGFPHNVLQTYSIQRPIMMRNAVFGDWVRLTFENVGCDLSGSIFEGVTDIDNLSNQQEVSLRQCKFLGRLKVDAGNSRFAIDFTKSEFCERARFSQVDSLESLLFAGCRFAYAPEFSSEVKLPPKTSFDRAEFTVRAEDESAYRTIRNAFATPRARDAEGRFYAYEKQAQRMSLRRDQWLQRIISWLYDKFSRYGSSYERALFWFAGFQLAFGLLYAWKSDRLDMGRSLDGAVPAFTFAQVVKPFELFTSRPVAGNALEVVGPDPSGWWLLLTASQSLASLSLVALILLALRWRFRRE